jgi:hypothetical protein
MTDAGDAVAPLLGVPAERVPGGGSAPLMGLLRTATGGVAQTGFNRIFVARAMKLFRLGFTGAHGE